MGNPAKAFHHTTWALLKQYMPDMGGKRVCVPSSGDNHAVFAFAMMGAQVTSCDISENQLANAQRIAAEHGWGRSIEFVCADTMKLNGIADNAYDFVYTSNGVHVWINDLPGMYHNIMRIIKPGGTYMLYELHPFQRPFGDQMSIKRPYDSTGPFESDLEINYTWRMMDIMNAMLSAGLQFIRLDEMFAEKNYEEPFWIPYHKLESGVTATREEVDRMYDWQSNPIAALPNWMYLVAQKKL